MQTRLYGIIYRAVSPSGKAYIGQTVRTLKQRRAQHYQKGTACTLLRKAVIKHGKDAIQWEVIACAWDKDGLDFAERTLIAQHGTLTPNGYNLTTGGESATYSKEAREKISKSNKISHSTPEAKAEMSARSRAFWKNPGHREKISAAVRKAWQDPKRRAKVSAAAKKQWSDPETRAIMERAFSNPRYRALQALKMRLFYARRRTPIGYCLPLV